MPTFPLLTLVGPGRSVPSHIVGVNSCLTLPYRQSILMSGDSTPCTERVVRVVDSALDKFEIAFFGPRMDMNQSCDTLEEEIRQSGRRTRLRLVFLSTLLTLWVTFLTLYL